LLLKIVRNFIFFSFAIFLGSSFWLAQAVVLADTGSDHIKSTSAVDNGEIRYGGTTKHTTARSHSFSQWNSLGTIKIAADTASTIQDLTYRDVYSVEDFTGTYTYLAGADEIKFNDRFFETRTDSWNKKTATHELGHALGIVDHKLSTHSGIIMYYQASQVTTLQAHDKADYNLKW
jgi:hypothetical protein